MGKMEPTYKQNGRREANILFVRNTEISLIHLTFCFTFDIFRGLIEELFVIIYSLLR